MKKDALYIAQEDYVTGIVPLMVWHIWDLARKKIMPVSTGLDEVCWLYRLTTLNNGVWPNKEGFDNPEWNDFKPSLSGTIEGCMDAGKYPKHGEKVLRAAVSLSGAQILSGFSSQEMGFQLLDVQHECEE